MSGLKEGDTVQAGDVIGFMGRTGYSTTENVNNIEIVHLHFGLQLVFDESQKECNSEIWIDVYDIVRLLNRHRSSVQWNPEKAQWERIYEFRDSGRLDVLRRQELSQKQTRSIQVCFLPPWRKIAACGAKG